MHPLGKSDLLVSDLCLGTMQFGWTADEEMSFRVMDAFVEAGGNFIDTADIYSRWSPGNPGGVSEEIIGRWLKARRNRADVVIATKVRGPMWEGADGEGLSRRHIERAVEDSLRRLQVDTIDLYQTHWPDEEVPLAETLGVFADLVAAGKVRHIGLSNYTTEQMEEALRLSGDGRFPRFVSLQPHYNLVWRAEYESSRMELCVRHGIAVIPYSPLEGGFLSGRYRRGEAPPDSPRAQGAQRFMNDEGFAVVEALERIGAARGVRPGAVAITWLRSRPGIVSPIIGANSPEQLSELLPAATLALRADEIGALDEVSKPFARK
jgi:aryl-alcohol dehydrogenase-like predicted oxidoreductase